MRHRPDAWRPEPANSVRACFFLWYRLRAQPASAAELLQRWQRQKAAGYRLRGLFNGGPAIARPTQCCSQENIKIQLSAYQKSNCHDHVTALVYPLIAKNPKGYSA